MPLSWLGDLGAQCTRSVCFVALLSDHDKGGLIVIVATEYKGGAYSSGGFKLFQCQQLFSRTVRYHNWRAKSLINPAQADVHVVRGSVPTVVACTSAAPPQPQPPASTTPRITILPQLQNIKMAHFSLFACSFLSLHLFSLPTLSNATTLR